jgi:ribosomal protein L20
MKPRKTGRAASVARNEARKSAQSSSAPSTTVRQTTGSVPSATAPSSGGGGSARGDDFAGSITGSDIGSEIKDTKVNTTPRTRTQLKKAKFDLGGGGGGIDQEKLRRDSINRQNKIKKDNRERRERLSRNGRLTSDNLRAGEVNRVQNEAITTQGGRSTRVLSDKEVNDLGARGFFEGDFVPGEGKLLPDGTFDRSMIDTFESIKAKTDDVVSRFNALKEQEKTAATSAVASDTSVVQEEKSALNSIASAAKDSPISQTLALLDQQILNINNQLKEDVRQIGRDFNQSRKTLEGQQEQETGQQSVQIANAGGYLGFTGSGQGVMLKLAEGHRAELTALDVARQKAINEARSAAAERKFDVVKEKASAIQRIEEAAYEAELEYQAKIQAEKEKEIAAESERQTQSDILAAIQNGSKDVTSIFNSLGGTVDIETINKTLKGITADVGDGFKFSASNNAALLGSGLGMDDIKALNEYINENGYDATVRSNLSASQKAALDKIFLPIQKVTGSTSTGNAMSILDLDRLEESYGVRFPFGVTQGQVTQFFADNPGATPEEMQQAINESLGGGGGEDSGGGVSIQVNKDWLSSNLSIDQQKRLADLVGASSWFTGKETDVNRMYNDPGLMQSLSNKIQELRDQDFSDDDILSALTT